MVHVDELGLENAEIYNVACLNSVEIGLFGRSDLVELALKYTEREASAVDRHVDRAKKIGNTADVILVTMSYENSAHLMSISYKVGEIGNDEINAGHILIGKSHSAIYDDYIVSVLEKGYVLADLLQTAERDYLQLTRSLVSGSFFLRFCYLLGVVKVISAAFVGGVLSLMRVRTQSRLPCLGLCLALFGILFSLLISCRLRCNLFLCLTLYLGGLFCLRGKLHLFGLWLISLLFALIFFLIFFLHLYYLS